jgi:hypothetical protein
MALNIMALIVLIFVTSFVVYVVFRLGGLPGRIATQRHHLQADAIRIMGWLGLLTGGIVWAVALVWAYITPKPVPLASPSGEPESAAAN